MWTRQHGENFVLIAPTGFPMMWRAEIGSNAGGLPKKLNVQYLAAAKPKHWSEDLDLPKVSSDYVFRLATQAQHERVQEHRIDDDFEDEGILGPGSVDLDLNLDFNEGMILEPIGCGLPDGFVEDAVRKRKISLLGLQRIPESFEVSKKRTGLQLISNEAEAGNLLPSCN